MVARASRRVDGQDGQGLVEIALVLPIFLLVLIGVFDVGRLVYTNAALSQAAREGARLAATEAPWIGLDASGCVATATDITTANPGAHVCPSSTSAFRAHIESAVNRMAVSLGPIAAVHISCNDGSVGDPTPAGAWTDTSGGNGCEDPSGTPLGASGEKVSVRVEYTYDPVTPVIGSLIGSIALSGSASMEIN